MNAYIADDKVEINNLFNNLLIIIMMNMKYLMKGITALALVAGFASCVKDVEGLTPAQEDEQAKENAELQLGITIPEGQTWNMSTQVSANIGVTLNPSESYTVGICDKNPLNYADAKFYVLKKVENGGISATFTAPSGKKDYYVVAYNSKYQALVNRVDVENGIINANISYTSANSRSMRGTNRATAHGITFPDGPAESDYKTTYPDGTAYIHNTGGYAAGIPVYADESSTGEQINVQPGWDQVAQKGINGGPVYIVKHGETGIVAPSSFYLDARNEGGAYLYICPGATLKLNTTDGKNLQKGVKVYIAQGATLETEGDLVLNTLSIYNAGTITVHGDLTLNASNVKGSPDISVLYNQGTINVDGYLAPQNGNCYIVNEDKITADKFGSEGSGTLWNVTGGEIDITNSTVVNSNSNGWVNDGEYTTNTFLYNAGSVDVYNSCKLTVKSNFEINLGDSPTSAFYNESSIICEKDFLFSGPGRIIMSSNALLDVQGTATMNICNPRKYGIWGPESGNYAVFTANNVVKGSDNQGLVSYGGKLVVVCNSHFDQGWKGQYPIIAGGGEDGSGETEVTIYQGGEMPDIPEIPATECNPGFKPGGGGGDFLDEPEPYTFAFEDQIYNGDYDLNDVVLKVSYHAERDNKGRITEIQENKLDVTLVAAGATFEIEAYIGDVKLFGKEVHDAFGKYNSNKNITQPMINTGNGKAIEAEPVFQTINAPANWDGDFNHLNVWIWVNPNSGKTSETKIYFITEKPKPAPYAIMIPNDWRWPLETIKIFNAYPGAKTDVEGVYNDEYSFKKWAETADAQRTDAMRQWFEHPAEGKTMTNE